MKLSRGAWAQTPKNSGTCVTFELMKQTAKLHLKMAPLCILCYKFHIVECSTTFLFKRGPFLALNVPSNGRLIFHISE